MTRLDQLVERGADRLHKTARRLGQENSLTARLAGPLAEDADFLRKLKPSLMLARAKGEAPTDEKPGEPRMAPAGPQLGKRSRPKTVPGGGPNPILVAGAAFAAGVLLAKWIDWRGHAHPRR
jgi:hypothetical protein